MLVHCDEYTARFQYSCDLCEHPIFPGDQYLRKTRLHRNKKYRCITVWREHVSPLCPYDPPADCEDTDTSVSTEQLPLDFKMAA